MLKRMAVFFQKYPCAHKILSFIYNKFVVKIITGYYLNCVKYFVGIYFPEKNRLKKYGLKRIKPVQCEGWRWGKGLDKAYRRYYVAIYNEKKCFIKVAKNDATIVNEIRVNTYLKDVCEVADFTTELIISDENFCENTAMMVIEYINDLQNFYIPQEIAEFECLCKSFVKILNELEKGGIVHADIHKGNLMLINGKPILLDFGISKIKDIDNNIDYKARPGTFFRTDGENRVYNDAYSFIKMLEKMGISETYKGLEVYESIEKLCDTNCFTVNVD